MRRAKILSALTHRSQKARIDEIEGTLVPLIKGRNEALATGDVKGIVSVILEALNGPANGKTDRRLVELLEVIGGYVAVAPDDEASAEKADELCAAVLGFFEKIEAPNKVHARALRSLLRGVVGEQGENVLASLRYTRPRPKQSLTGKQRKANEEAPRNPDEPRPPHQHHRGLQAARQRAAAVMKKEHPKRVLQLIVSLAAEQLVSAYELAGWLAGFSSIVPHVLALAEANKGQAAYLPMCLAIELAAHRAASDKDGSKHELIAFNSIEKRAERTAAVVAACVKVPAHKVWSYALKMSEEKGVRLGDRECNEAAQKAFSEMAGEAKRAIESVLPALSPCLALFQDHVDSAISKILQPLVEPTMKSLRDATLRSEAESAMTSILRYVPDVDLRKSIIQSLCALLKDAKSVEERVIAIEALNKATPSMFQDGDASRTRDSAKIVAEVIYPAVKQHASGPPGLELLKTCISLSKSLPDYLAATLKDALQATDDTTKHRALMILPFVPAADSSKLKDVQSTLGKLCAEAEKKLPSRFSALLALSAVDIGGTEKWYTEGCLGTTPYLFSLDNLKRASEPWQLAAAVESCTRFLPPATAKTGTPPKFNAAQDIGPLLGLVLLATHPRSEVRRGALAAISAAIDADKTLAGHFWTAFVIAMWMPSLSLSAPAAGAVAEKKEAKAAKPAAKPGGKKAAKGFVIPPHPGMAGGAKDAKKDDKKAAAAEVQSHPFILDEKAVKAGAGRMPLWKLSEALPPTTTLDTPGSRSEAPAAAELFCLLGAALAKQEASLTSKTITELVLTSGHSAVSGPHGNYFDCTAFRYERYRTRAEVDAFVKVFGTKYNPDTVVDSYKPAGHALWKHRDAVRRALIDALSEADGRKHVVAAAGRAIAFLALHSGHDGLHGVFGKPLQYDDIETYVADAEDGSTEPRAESSEQPTETRRSAWNCETFDFPRLAERMEAQIAKLAALTPIEVRVAQCYTEQKFEQVVQQQLEDDDVVPRSGSRKDVYNVKRDKSQKGLYSREDEEWEREWIRKKNAEKGIEDPKVAKARAETHDRFTALRTSLQKEMSILEAYLLAIVQTCTDTAANAAVHECLPQAIPVVNRILREVPIFKLKDLAEDLLEWLFRSTPVLELKDMYSSLAAVTVKVVENRKSAAATGKIPYDDETVSGVEATAKRLRASSSHLLPAASFSIIFPLCEAVMCHTSNANPFSLICQRQCMAVVSTNTGLPDLPHREACSVGLLTLLDQTPALAKTGIAALSSLAEHLRFEEMTPITEALISPSPIQREAAVVALKHFPRMPEASAKTKYLLLSCTFDENRGNRRKARETWTYHELSIGDDFIDILVPVVLTSNTSICEAAADALAEGIKTHPEQQKLALQQLFRAFDAHLAAPDTLKSPDRKGVATAIAALIPLLTPDCMELITKFCCQRALLDVNAEVRENFMTAFQQVVATHGRAHHDSMLPVLQRFFANGPPAAQGPAGPAGALTPAIKEAYTAAIVVVMGTISAQMDDAPHLDALAGKLIDTANTTSEAIALSVFNTMAIVIQIKNANSQREKLVARCLEKILKGNAQADVRRSYAQALAGIVKGCKLPSLKELRVLSSLERALTGKGHGKEGALLSFAVFCERLEGLYEPYVIHQIRLVVDAFADKEQGVKKAAEECAAAMMKSLSHFGVRQILPPLIKSFDTDNWRTKVSALNLLGQMSYCSPKQLAAALPKVMPVLRETLADSHREVQQNAWDALRRVGGVITNPEIAAHANQLLDALRRPTEETDNALEALLYTRFANVIDAASLAVIEPIIRRGLAERTSSTKQKAAQIVGSVALVIEDPLLMVPYLDELLKQIKAVILDEHPDCRSTGAKALGNLVTSLTAERFPGLMQWCFDTLSNIENSFVERSGAAQAAAEVIKALKDDEKLVEYLYYIKEKTHDPTYQVREGFLQVLVYLPHALGQGYQPHLKEMTPCVVRGLSDENEGVREMSVKAGQTLVHLFGMKCLDQLLPPLQTGLTSDEWRVRLSSLQLLGDLLMRVATENMRMMPVRHVEEEDLEEEDSEEESEESDDEEDKGGLQPQKRDGPLTLRDLRRMRADKTTNSVINALGDVIGNHLLGSLMATVYMLTVDIAMVVSREAKQVWKALVDNTPAMLRKIMDVLTPRLVEYISTDNPEHREVAGRCVGDLVQRLGDGFLPSILPVLANGLNAENSESQRLGATLALKEVVRSVSKQQYTTYSNIITPAVVQAIKDDDPEVREEAGLAFNMLFEQFGGRTIENLMKNLITAIMENDQQAMAGTLEMLKMRPIAVLGQLIPTFLKEKYLTESLARGLIEIANLADEHIKPHIIELVPLLSATLALPDLEYEDTMVEAVEALLLRADSERLYALMGEIRNLVQSMDPAERRGGVGLIGALMQCEELELEVFYTAYIQNVVRLYGDVEVDVQKSALNAMRKVSAKFEANDLFTKYQDVVHGALQTAAMGTFSTGGSLPALDIIDPSGDKKTLGLATVLPFYTRPLQTGTNEERENAASGILEVVDLVSAETIKACVGDVIGPMIRKMNDVMPSSTKCALLTCISGCIKRVGSSAKQFIVMLQTAFPKNLANADADVRRCALESLYILMKHQEPRLDPTLNSLALEIKAASHPLVQISLLRGLTVCLGTRPDAALGPMVAKKCQEIVMPLMKIRPGNGAHARAIGKAVGIIAPLIDEHCARDAFDKAHAYCGQGGRMLTLGMALWHGLLTNGVGKPGAFHQDYVAFTEDAIAALPASKDADELLAMAKACLAYFTHGAHNEVGISEAVALSAAMVKAGNAQIAGDRSLIHAEGALRFALIASLDILPAKYQAPVNKVISALANVEREEDMCSETEDDARENQ
ncbi:eIF-2-alpha kinase activator GCN1 [Diplonema papillatum]|nr:eIF-2-alpha kinase activator GCN1 [Diplonema papillatum]